VVARTPLFTLPGCASRQDSNSAALNLAHRSRQRWLARLRTQAFEPMPSATLRRSAPSHRTSCARGVRDAQECPASPCSRFAGADIQSSDVRQPRHCLRRANDMAPAGRGTGAPGQNRLAAHVAPQRCADGHRNRAHWQRWMTFSRASSAPSLGDAECASRSAAADACREFATRHGRRRAKIPTNSRRSDSARCSASSGKSAVCWCRIFLASHVFTFGDKVSAKLRRDTRTRAAARVSVAKEDARRWRRVEDCREAWEWMSDTSRGSLRRARFSPR
jgi:hypothetical protein